MSLLHADISEAIIKGFYHVYNTLGYGFLEKVYENSLLIALRVAGLIVEQQSPITVRFEDEVVGEYFADLLINKKVVVEIKAAKAIAPEHESQLLNYLRATGYQVGLVLNFGPKPEFRRKVFTTSTDPWNADDADLADQRRSENIQSHSTGVPSPIKQIYS
jgi:GxxExxY protein